MPVKKRPSKAKKHWYTYAFFTAEGEPHPAQRLRNFTQVYQQLVIALDDLARVIVDERFHKGAHAVALWPGQLSEWEALHGKTKPLYYIYQGGRTERL